MLKTTMICLCFLMLHGFGNAQVVVNLPTIQGNLEDRLSQRSYDNINSANGILATQELGNKGNIAILTPIFNTQLKELTSLHANFTAQERLLKTFINSTAFSRSRGFNSFGYIRKKYPIINPLNPTAAFQNKIIQLRFSRKLKTEKNKILDYLDKDNPMPEGERVLLVLTALENVINLTLENENY
jgi:hypothetical protein